jgi:hypothetical protein
MFWYLFKSVKNLLIHNQVNITPELVLFNRSHRLSWCLSTEGLVLDLVIFTAFRAYSEKEN